MKSLVRVFLGGIFLFTVITAQAAEGGVGHYTPGSFASFVDVLPDTPSVAVFNYFVYYNGAAGAGRSFPIGAQIASNVKAITYADSPGAFWVTPLKILGANYAAGISLPIESAEVTAQVSLPRGLKIRRSSSVTGLGDIEFWPVALSWSALNKDLHVDFFGGIYAPTGQYQTNQLANLGLGYWTFEPGVLASYLSQKNGFEFTTYLGYDINTENTATHYLSGQQFHVDVTVAQHLPLGKGFLGIGANAFYLQQTTPDSGSGALLGSFEEMTSGIGPVLSYAQEFGKIGVAAEVKWLPQIGVQNTVAGNYIWFKAGVQF